MRIRIIPLALMLLLSASLKATPFSTLEVLTDEVVAKHMIEKQIPGMSVAVVHEGNVVFSKGYGEAVVEFDVPATPSTVFPISSVSRMFAGLLAIRLADAGLLELDSSISKFLADAPSDKQAITVRHLLQHAHGLVDFYHSETFEKDTGKSARDSTTGELLSWSLSQPLAFSPGTDWAYGVIGYVLLQEILEDAGGKSYVDLVEQYVFEPLDMKATYGGSETIVAGRNPLLYELVDDEVAGHVVDFPPRVYAAAGLNLSVLEMAKLFVALSTENFISEASKQELWHNQHLSEGEYASYGLGWFTYETSQGRWVVGHEGGGASWVIYYPDLDLAVVALSNMSGARADILPYEIARQAIATGQFSDQPATRLAQDMRSK